MATEQTYINTVCLQQRQVLKQVYQASLSDESSRESPCLRSPGLL